MLCVSISIIRWATNWIMSRSSALRGEDWGSIGLRADRVALGHILEAFVFCELEESLPLLKDRWPLYHWRQAPREIDIVAQAPRQPPRHVRLQRVELRGGLVCRWRQRIGDLQAQPAGEMPHVFTRVLAGHP